MIRLFQMISKMAPDLEMHDVEMIAEILKSVEGQPREGEIEVIALLTKTASLRADDAMTLDEAAELANMVRFCVLLSSFLPNVG